MQFSSEPYGNVEPQRVTREGGGRYSNSCHTSVGLRGSPYPLKGALIPIVALTRRFPLAPFGWSGTRGPFP
jgi:hypothetical protein